MEEGDIIIKQARRPRQRRTPVIKINEVKTKRRVRTRKVRNRGASKPQKIPVPIGTRSIQKCTAEYASALVNPFGTRKTLPCIPDTICMASNKIQTRVRGVFSTGTAGVGFVALDPFLMVKNDGANGAASTSFPVVYTTPAYAGNTYDSTVALGNFLPGVVGANANGTYTNAFLNGNGRQFRLVAAGLKVNYVGNNFYNQGRLTLYREQGNNAVTQGSTVDNLLQNNYATMIPISRKAEYVFYVPDDHNFLDYNRLIDFDPNIAAQPSHRSMLIFIDGGALAPNSQSWSFECTAYYELVGPNLTLSPSHSDPQGQGAVMESLPVKNPTATPSVVQSTVLNRVYNKLQETVTNYGPALADMGMSYLGAQFGRRINSPMIEDAD